MKVFFVFGILEIVFWEVSNKLLQRLLGRTEKGDQRGSNSKPTNSDNDRARLHNAAAAAAAAAQIFERLTVWRLRATETTVAIGHCEYDTV